MRLTPIRLAVLLLLACALPLAAQPFGKSDPGSFRQEVRVSDWVFHNFNWATVQSQRQNVNAIGAEYRIAWHPNNFTPEVYGHLGYLNYDQSGRKASVSERLGIFHEGDIHQFNAYVDHASNRASYNVGNTVGQASVTSFAGEYYYRVVPSWDIGAAASTERQRFNVQTNLDNDYTLFSAGVRYRGFGWRIVPEVGYQKAHLSTDATDERYHDARWYGSIAWIPQFVPKNRLYLSARYGHGTRDYQTTVPFDSNVGRNDTRPQWSGVAVYRATDHLRGILYYTREDVTSSLPGRAFNYDVAIATIAYGF
jgi:hypothetical protein